MLKEIRGDLFNFLPQRSQHTLIMHGCNAIGVMGAGFARQIKNRYPEAFIEYEIATRKIGSGTGDVYFKQINSRSLTIANAITQHSPGPCAKLELIEECLKVVERYSEGNNIERFMAPRIGCGIGGLDWKDVKPLFEQSSLDWEIYYF